MTSSISFRLFETFYGFTEWKINEWKKKWMNEWVSPPTARTAKFLPILYDFPVRLRNSLSHTQTHTKYKSVHTLMPKVSEATDERMSNQTLRPLIPRNCSHTKKTETVRTHKTQIRLQVERSNFWTDRQQQKKRNTVHNMDGWNIRNPDHELAWHPNCLCYLPCVVSFM